MVSTVASLADAIERRFVCRIERRIACAVLDGERGKRDGEGKLGFFQMAGNRGNAAHREITGFSQGLHGSVVDNGDGTFTYTHDGSETTSDSFTYIVDDGAGGTATATVNVTVTAVNEAPTAAMPTGAP